MLKSKEKCVKKALDLSFLENKDPKQIGMYGEYHHDIDPEDIKKLKNQIGRVEPNVGIKKYKTKGMRSLINVAQENLVILFLGPYIRDVVGVRIPNVEPTLSLSGVLRNHITITKHIPNATSVSVFSFIDQNLSHSDFDSFEDTNSHITDFFSNLFKLKTCETFRNKFYDKQMSWGDCHTGNFLIDIRYLESVKQQFIKFFMEHRNKPLDNILEEFYDDFKHLFDASEFSTLVDFGEIKCTNAVAEKCGLKSFENKIKEAIAKRPNSDSKDLTPLTIIEEALNRTINLWSARNVNAVNLKEVRKTDPLGHGVSGFYYSLLPKDILNNLQGQLGSRDDNLGVKLYDTGNGLENMIGENLAFLFFAPLIKEKTGIDVPNVSARMSLSGVLHHKAMITSHVFGAHASDLKVPRGVRNAISTTTGNSIREKLTSSGLMWHDLLTGNYVINDPWPEQIEHDYEEFKTNNPGFDDWFFIKHYNCDFSDRCTIIDFGWFYCTEQIAEESGLNNFLRKLQHHQGRGYATPVSALYTVGKKLIREKTNNVV